MAERQHVILASGSSTRHEMLKAAGLAFTVVPADIDEEAIRQALTLENEAIDPADIAEVLARAKGEEVSKANPGSLVIAADQTLSMQGHLFSKPENLSEARETLLRLRGEQHFLHTSVAIAEDGEVTWTDIESARLRLRSFSRDYLDEYLLRAGEGICQSVGAYQIEKLGIQLFEEIDGDYFTILGLPMLPLLAELRRRGVLTD
jgi:nucleoside triphosphate pyrophosphatase